MKGIRYIENFAPHADELFHQLRDHVHWDERMAARKTASFGKAYNYSQIEYPDQAFPPALMMLLEKINSTIGFKPNNCLINYYLDGRSKMGFHSDQTDILMEGTGVVIVSLGATRILRFRNIENKEIIEDYSLPSGSLIYMTNEVQTEWQHAIPKSETQLGRMSLTFRHIV